MEVINHHTAGINVGSKSHCVAVEQILEDVKEFGVYAEEIAKVLHGNNRSDFLFGLKQEYDTYCFLQKRIQACDKKISRFVKMGLRKHPELKRLKTVDKP